MAKAKKVERLSLSAYARHRKALGLPGGSLANVQKAVKTSRITRGPDGLIDAASADKEWAANTDHSKRTTKTPPATTAKKSPKAKTEKQAQANTEEADSFVKARRVKEEYNARLAQLDYEVRIGKLVPADQVEQRWAHIVSIARTRLLSVPSKVKAKLPKLEKKDMAVIDAILREALEGLAGDDSHLSTDE